MRLRVAGEPRNVFLAQSPCEVPGEVQAPGTICNYYKCHSVPGIVLGIRAKATKPTWLPPSGTMTDGKYKDHSVIVADVPQHRC